jgi:hypothetical protein
MIILVRQMAAIAACGIMLPLCLAATPVRAQFVCTGTQAPGSATAAGSNSNFACASNTDASGTNSSNVAVGEGAFARGNDSINTAVGATANAFGDSSHNVAVGLSKAGGNNSNNVAAGFADASGAGSQNIALGFLANASGAGSSNIAIGNNALAEGDGTSSMAIGNLANASGTNAMAVGNNAKAGFANSAAFGNGATATRANQQVFGTATNTYTMAGITSAASRAAQNGPTQIVTSDSAGNLAAASLASLGLASSADIAGINSRLNDLDNRTNVALTGVAMALAMAGVPTLLPSEKFAVTANYGTYDSKNGVAFNAAVRLSDMVQLNGGVGFGVNDQVVGGRVGLRMGW